MTQTFFSAGENPVTSLKLNTAVQGYRFLRRSSFIGLPEPLFYRCHPRCAAFLARLVGPGGGGGGAAGGGAQQAAAGSGGGAGGYTELFTRSQVLIRQTLTIIAPQGGAGGLGGNTQGLNASSGAAILFPSLSGVPLTLCGAQQGAGGNFMFPDTTTLFLGGGLGGFGFGGDINMTGEAGGAAVRLGANIALSGRGGNSVFRGAGREVASSAAGFPAASFGGGGGGSAALTTGQPGGRGGDALVIMDEYY